MEEKPMSDLEQMRFARLGETAPAPDAASQARKETPVFSGVLNYFPDAIRMVAQLSWTGNEKHNPGEPLHWAKGKSTDHADCIARHLLDIGKYDPTNDCDHAVAVAWRALALLQDMHEKGLLKNA